MNRYTFTLKRTATGETFTNTYAGPSRDEARKALETYLFRTAQRGYEVID